MIIGPVIFIDLKDFKNILTVKSKIDVIQNFGQIVFDLTSFIGVCQGILGCNNRLEVLNTRVNFFENVKVYGLHKYIGSRQAKYMKNKIRFYLAISYLLSMINIFNLFYSCYFSSKYFD